jgi:hypothetical protein
MNAQPKNYRKTPDVVLAKASGLQGLAMNVGCVKRITLNELKSGLFNHLGLVLKAGNQLALPAEVVPLQETGRYSRKNCLGETLIRRDLPKETRFDDRTIPIFGDYSRGTCTISVPVRFYPREHKPPQLTPIKIRLLTTVDAQEDRQFIIYFTAGDPMETADENFERELFRRLNLLRENVGDATVFGHGDSTEELMRDISVNWEILPAGHWQLLITQVLSSIRNPSESNRRVLEERMHLLRSLQPSALVRGTGGFDGYFGAQFGNFLVFENLRFGNAIYILHNNWEALSQLSRTELLESHRAEILRIEHRPGWENRLVNLVGFYRNPPIAA